MDRDRDDDRYDDPRRPVEGPVGPKLRFWPSRRTFWERGIRY